MEENRLDENAKLAPQSLPHSGLEKKSMPSSESGGERARTPDAPRGSETPGTREVSGVRVSSAPLSGTSRDGGFQPGVSPTGKEFWRVRTAPTNLAGNPQL
jgi:hypothetical protein